MNKVAIFAPYVGRVNRGTESFVIELTKTLNTEYEIDVYTTALEPQIKNNCVVVKIRKNILLKVHEFFYNNNGLYRKLICKNYFLIPEVIFQKKFSKKVFKIINRKKYDLLFPNNGYWGSYYCNKYRKKYKVPYIYTGHGGIGFGEEKILNCNPDCYITLTTKQTEWAKSFSKERINIHMIPNGVDISMFNKKVEKIDTPVKTILSVGALTKFKRHELTIEAVSLLNNCNLLILGRGEEQEYLKKLAKDLLNERCNIQSVEYKEINKYYQKADLFVLPSLEEPFGIVYLEAMAANIPIVAPNDSQRKEIIKDAGMYCNVENIQEYALTIEKALNTDFSDKPLNVVKKYDWSIICKKYSRLFKQIIQKGSQL